MGYIMPIENYQYQQYHQRVTQQEHDPFPIERLYPIQSSMYYNQERSKEEPRKNLIPQTKVRNTNKSKDIENEHPKHKIYSEVTGKGINFQAKV
ncbi:hypothetical protein JCM21714_3415 [Gracilibacillus boraciitolerans JCM 21714]|uniref:Uncharacterized protein n=1 Tax=Gracilibacillus boraciitolerans JCM 21714 TaxID=1298598 RepID=W4VLL8_9BACI|nr:hypothetical protein [Gracilibacillus boraciitolerans]GAE94275.1 hypothetical protein JCM21714_3415 [Gracilibacillus boraciitolerans JCM 21714]